MYSKKKILAFTSIRSDYDLMSGLYKKLDNSKNIELQLIVSGAHLSDSYGYTLSEIEKGNFNILAKVETLLDSNSKQSRIKSASLLLQSLTDIVADYAPDVLIYAGDREDVIVYALLGSYLQIPTVHFFGGDHVNDGHVDNPVRHATSKLSSLHFVTLPQHKERLIKMGEISERVFVTGSLSLDRFYQHKACSRQEVFLQLKIPIRSKDYALVIFHPQDLELKHSHLYLKIIFKYLKSKGLFVVASYPNTDPGNKKIIELIESLKADENNFYFYRNLTHDLFISMYKNASIQVGNSSAGIIESASIPIPVVNVGLRQLGRVANKNVVFCKSTEEGISNAIEKVLSKSFKKSIENITNIYGDGNSVEKAYNYLKNIDFSKYIYKREDPLEI